jgi:molybdopterin-binding protein
MPQLHLPMFPNSAIHITDQKVSARNMIAGTIKYVKKGATTSHVLLDIGGTVITASIMNEAVDELKLAAGQKANASLPTL